MWTAGSGHVPPTPGMALPGRETPTTEALPPKPCSHLHGSALCREGSEAHYITEVDGDTVESLSPHCLSTLQLLCHRAGKDGGELHPKPPVPPATLAPYQHGKLARDPMLAQQRVHAEPMPTLRPTPPLSLPLSLGQNLVEEVLCLALLLQVGLCPLFHQLLQVVGILLHA